ncbi:Mitochondrial translocator assembly and maintenance protein 41 [Chytridiales sp. JEL 0842]|nr:Mitochondrial translocator assembly and maintenance protein 41 [Chytridiales sp. JEL 0842]
MQTNSKSFVTPWKPFSDVEADITNQAAQSFVAAVAAASAAFPATTLNESATEATSASHNTALDALSFSLPTPAQVSAQVGDNINLSEIDLSSVLDPAVTSWMDAVLMSGDATSADNIHAPGVSLSEIEQHNHSDLFDTTFGSELALLDNHTSNSGSSNFDQINATNGNSMQFNSNFSSFFVSSVAKDAVDMQISDEESGGDLSIMDFESSAGLLGIGAASAMDAQNSIQTASPLKKVKLEPVEEELHDIHGADVRENMMRLSASLSLGQTSSIASGSDATPKKVEPSLNHDQADVKAKPKRGRKKGSTNKKKVADLPPTLLESLSPPQAESSAVPAKRKVGRPSKKMKKEAEAVAVDVANGTTAPTYNAGDSSADEFGYESTSANNTFMDSTMMHEDSNGNVVYGYRGNTPGSTSSGLGNGIITASGQSLSFSTFVPSKPVDPDLAVQYMRLKDPNLSSKERRQLRNKLSARSFRERRKEYIETLEGEVARHVEEKEGVKKELEKVKEERDALKNLLGELVGRLKGLKVTEVLDGLEGLEGLIEKEDATPLQEQKNGRSTVQSGAGNPSSSSSDMLDSILKDHPEHQSSSSAMLASPGFNRTIKVHSVRISPPQPTSFTPTFIPEPVCLLEKPVDFVSRPWMPTTPRIQTKEASWTPPAHPVHYVTEKDVVGQPVEPLSTLGSLGCFAGSGSYWYNFHKAQILAESQGEKGDAEAPKSVLEELAELVGSRDESAVGQDDSEEISETDDLFGSVYDVRKPESFKLNEVVRTANKSDGAESLQVEVDKFLKAFLGELWDFVDESRKEFVVKLLAVLLMKSPPPSGAENTLWADSELQKILEDFNAPVRFAAGYGSGVLKQDGYDDFGDAQSGPMVDLIFAVTHSEHWHSLNLRQNRAHYSLYGALGAKSVSVLQDTIGGRIYYNPNVIINGKRVKYGVISMDSLLKDLTEWDSLYVAGRMQKPLKILRGDSRIKLANDLNLLNAARVALLSLPEQFTQEDFFKTIVSISYTGDFRMIFGENPKKIQNIVSAQLPHLQALYTPPLSLLKNVSMPPEGFPADPTSTIKQDMDPKVRAGMLLALPKRTQFLVCNYHQQRKTDDYKLGMYTDMLLNKTIGLTLDIPGTEGYDLAIQVVSSPDVKLNIKKALAEIIRLPAFAQSVKGIITAGPSKSVAYVGEKLSKRFK